MNEPSLPRAVYTASQVRTLDRIAIERYAIAGYTLMTRAAQAALAALRREWPLATRLAVVCGAGNNAGDGYVLARLAARERFAVRVFACVPAGELHGDAERAVRDCAAAGVAIEPFPRNAESTPTANSDHADAAITSFAPDVIVDALFGTGLNRPLDGEFVRAAEWINASALPVLALDVPSGLDADRGVPLGAAVRASLTVSFVGLKQGLFLGTAKDYCGKLVFSDLGIPPDAASELAPALERLTLEDLKAALPRRARTAHKGDSGRLLVIGGAPGMSGAIRLAAEAGLRAGAGLVYVATHPHSAAAVAAGRPEAMCHAIATPAELAPLLALADGVVLGPGLGRSDWAKTLWNAVLATELPVVLDADGLNWLADSPHARGRWILTPHPGEASRLLGRSVADVQANRVASARELVARYDGVAVLKGACTLVAEKREERGRTPESAPDFPPILVCDRGNPGMATAGMGDVLSGVLGALLVQGNELGSAAAAGVLLHALAGDAAATAGERGTLAGDLMPEIRRWANPGP